jgi:sulfur relay (sulfurtransferase) complex TusBCD TusD component (DsrE family)
LRDRIVISLCRRAGDALGNAAHRATAMAQMMIVTTLAAGTTARRRLVSALAHGTAVSGVFFFSDGVEAAATRAECEAWHALAERHRLPLLLCTSSAQRRGFDTDARSPPGFGFAGLDRLATLADDVDTIDVAGR